MTTKVTVDAHAGWPVSVSIMDMNRDGEWFESNFTIVPAGTKQDFHIYDTRQLLISEMGKDDTSGVAGKAKER